MPQTTRPRREIYLRHKIPVKYAEKIADILTLRAGARFSSAQPVGGGDGSEFHWRLNRADFVHHATRSDDLEYRFQGCLGFGGKFRNHGRRWYVDCYQENETPSRLGMIKRANDDLSNLFDLFISEQRHKSARHSRRNVRI